MRSARAGRWAGLLLAAAWLTASPAAAQSGRATAALTGRVVAAATGEAVPYSLVTLLPAAGGPEATALTAADGSFRFDSIAPGEYRLRLDRWGYAPELQPPLHVTAARPEAAVVRSAPRPVRVSATAPADTVCRAAADLARVPGLAALWRDAATAAEVRRLFDRSYSFTVVRREVSWIAAGADRVRASVAEAPVTHTPEDAFVEELRASAPETVWGQVAQGQLQLLVPDLPQLFGRGFLARHCLVVVPAAGGGHRLDFVVHGAPAIPGAVRVAATLVLDSTDAVTRVELEYQVEGRVIARGSQQYTDAGFPGGQLRFASRLDLEEVPRLAGTTHWIGRHHYDNYRITRDTSR